MKQKLKGCRPSAEVMQDYSNVSAQLGDTVFQIDRGHAAKQILLKRQRELMLEANEAEKQEKALAANGPTNFKVGQAFEGESPTAPLTEVTA